jgi:signal transduction histidine kinase
MTNSRSFAWCRVMLHVIVPAGLTLALFVGAIFGLVLPRFQQSYLQQKQQLVEELTGTVHTLIGHYHDRQQNGELTGPEARQRALNRIRAMRYGPEGKDYFWIHDQHPVMLAHPYRPDLEGQDVSDLRDGSGKLLIVEMNRVLASAPDGVAFFDYLWASKVDSGADVPKLSCLRLYEPWGWVIGSGLYMDDVRADMAAITHEMQASVIVIFLIITGISAYLIWQGVCVELKRQSSQRKQAELMQSLAIKNDELKSVVYIASHDLRSPLVNLEGFSGELARSCRELADALAQPESADRQQRLSAIVTEQIPECLGFIQTNTQKMKGLVSGLLQLSRLGVMEVTVEPLAMEPLIRNVTDTCQFQLKEAGAAVTTGELPPCRADAKLVNQVFSNLIDNAIKYRHPDRGLTIDIAGQRIRNVVEYTVADNGIGIPADQRDKIFEMFHRIDPTGPRDGVGLGLTIVQRILDILGGQIRVDSALDRGTTFTVHPPGRA